MEEGKEKKPIHITISWLDAFKFWFAGLIFLLFLVIVSGMLNWIG